MEIIRGVGSDAPIVENEKGGKQSKTLYALHLIDPKFLLEFFHTREASEKMIYYRAVEEIAAYMIYSIQESKPIHLKQAIQWLSKNVDDTEIMFTIGEVLQEGAGRYAPNNWRLIPEEEHINHALIHILAHIAGDTQDNHIGHAMCRLMMAYATEKSEGFEYNKFVPKIDEEKCKLEFLDKQYNKE